MNCSILQRASRGALLLVAAMSMGCSGASIYYPESFFTATGEAAETARVKRLAENWNALLANASVRQGMKLKSGQALSTKGCTMLLFTSTGCPGHRLMSRFRIWEAMASLNPSCRAEVIYLDDNMELGPGSEWVYRRYAAETRWFASSARKKQIDRMFGVARYDQEKKGWVDFKGSRAERLKAARAAQADPRNGWIWPISPGVPMLMILRDGRVQVAKNGSPSLLLGTPREVMRRDVPEYDARLDAIMALPREKRIEELEAIPTGADLALGAKAAAVYLRLLLTGS